MMNKTKILNMSNIAPPKIITDDYDQNGCAENDQNDENNIMENDDQNGENAEQFGSYGSKYRSRKHRRPRYWYSNPYWYSRTPVVVYDETDDSGSQNKTTHSLLIAILVLLAIILLLIGAGSLYGYKYYR